MDVFGLIIALYICDNAIKVSLVLACEDYFKKALWILNGKIA